jgi:DNA-binding transcriptional MerR regulator
LGFSLDEIKQLLQLQNDQCGGAEQSHHIVMHHLTDVRHKIDKLQQLEHQLLEMVDRCDEAKAQSCLCLNELKKGRLK